MCLSEKCANLIQIINILALFSGIITSIVGISMIPQNINNGNTYVGTGEQYQEELKILQLSSYGFKITMAGMITVGYSILGCGCIYWYRKIDCRSTSVVSHPQPEPPAPKPLKSILKDTHDAELQLNINKWTGHVKPEDIV